MLPVRQSILLFVLAILQDSCAYNNDGPALESLIVTVPCTELTRYVKADDEVTLKKHTQHFFGLGFQLVLLPISWKAFIIH